MPHGFVPVPDAREWCDVGVRMRRNAVISSDAEILCMYVCRYVLYFVLFCSELNPRSLFRLSQHCGVNVCRQNATAL